METPLWTAEDQIALEAMEERKRQAATFNRKPIDEIAEEIHCHNIFASEIASGMIERADRIIAALKPFCKVDQTKGCPKCFGSGGKRSDPCVHCNGTGRIPK